MKEPEPPRKNKRLLQKKERLKALKSIRRITTPEILHTLKVVLHEKLQVREEPLKDIFDALLERGPLLKSVILYHQDVFTSCYNDCSAGKEKYLRFQLEWHNRCSVFLLPKKYDTSSVLRSSSDKVDDLHNEWLKFCDSYCFDSCCKVMIMLTSGIYDMLLAKVHQTIKCQSETVSLQVNGDGDDVYYRFGGAVICDMMQLRYKALKKCTLIRRSEILKEIEILESMNDKKECMPEYLKYRDKGYMYSPVKRVYFFFPCSR